MAKQVRSQAKPKGQTIPKEQARKFLAQVPEEQVFWCNDGRIFRDMKELGEGLAAMSFDTFVYHVNLAKNDFSNWLRNVVKDEKLALMPMFVQWDGEKQATPPPAAEPAPAAPQAVPAPSKPSKPQKSKTSRKKGKK